MARDLKLDSGNNLIRDGVGDWVFTDGIDEMRQNVETQLETQRGTHVRDLEFGFPFLDLVFKKNPNTTLISATAKTLLLSRSDVLSVKNLFTLIDPASRVSTMSFTAETTEGLLSLKGLEI